MKLLDYDLDIRYKKCKQISFPDVLSQTGTRESIENDFENCFHNSIQTPQNNFKNCYQNLTKQEIIILNCWNHRIHTKNKYN